jgi:signal transduction histidine kinase
VSQVLLSLARNALESLTAGAGASPDAPGGGRDVDDAPGARGVPGVEAPAGGAMRPGAPRLEIRAARAEAEVIVEVVDNGRGIAPEQVGQLFERAASGTGSTGLGLYLSRLLAESNGGTLGYVPAESGCCFRLTLPAAEAR